MADRTHQFPRNVGLDSNNQPFMILTSYESKNAITSVTHDSKNNPLPPLSSIALYIPPNALKQTTTSNWEGVERGALKAGAMNAGFSGFSEGMWSGDNGLGDTLARVGIGVGTTVVGEAAKAIDKQTGMLSAGKGIAVNNHMAMAYKGPGQFREHEFAFNFFPKKQQDAEDIRKIIADFKSGMLPRMKGFEITKGRTLSKPFFHSPRHWEIQFFHVVPGEGAIENQYLPKIKKSVITSMSVNHDPNSIVSLHADGSPVQTTLSLTFREIEFPTSGDPDSTQVADSYTEPDDVQPGGIYIDPTGQKFGLISPINPGGGTLGHNIPTGGNVDAFGNPIGN
jgi:hypothetical protein